MRAELEGENTCTMGELRVHSRTPVLVMCRLLVSKGIDPATPLEVYRSATLALRVGAIGEAAKLMAEEGAGRPYFRKGRWDRIPSGTRPRNHRSQGQG